MIRTHWIPAAAVLAAAAAPGWSLTPEAVFARVGPSVVMIRDAEGCASGVLVGSRLILTNYHTINTPLPQEVVVEIPGARGKQTRVFKKTRGVGVHPTYDLALIQIVDPATIPARPVAISPRPVAKGERIYVIGMAAGAEGDRLEKSIEHGSVTNPQAKVEGETLVATTAVVTPSSRGGAVCDAAGRVIGIAAFGDGEDESGYILPLAQYRQADLVAPADRPIDRQLAERLSFRGKFWYGIAQRASDDARKAAMVLAFLFYRMSLAEEPGNAMRYADVGALYEQLDQHELAVPFLEKALELQTDFPAASYSLGTALHHLGRHADAAAAFRKGVADKAGADVKLPHRRCAYGCAMALAALTRHAEAAFFARWAVAGLRRDYFPQSNQAWAIYNESVKHISDEQFAFLTGNEAPSTNQLPAYLKMTGSFVAPKPAGEALAAHEKRVEALMAPLRAAAPAGAIRKRLPDPPVDIQWARYGSCLALRFDSLRRIGILDLARGQFDKYIPLPADDALFATGGETLILCSPGRQIMEKWDLRTCTRVARKPLGLPGRIESLSMGSEWDGMALVGVRDEKQTSSLVRFYLINLDTLAPLRFRTPVQDSVHTTFHVTTDPWLARVAVTEGHMGNTSAEWIHIDGANATIRHNVSLYVPIRFNHDGRLFGDFEGKCLDTDLKTVGKLPSTGAPVYGAGFRACPDKDGTVRILAEDSLKEVCTVKPPEGAADVLWPSGRLGRLAFVSTKSEWADIVPMPLPQAGGTRP